MSKPCGRLRAATTGALDVVETGRRPRSHIREGYRRMDPNDAIRAFAETGAPVEVEYRA